MGIYSVREEREGGSGGECGGRSGRGGDGVKDGLVCWGFEVKDCDRAKADLRTSRAPRHFDCASSSPSSTVERCLKSLSLLFNTLMQILALQSCISTVARV